MVLATGHREELFVEFGVGGGVGAGAAHRPTGASLMAICILLWCEVQRILFFM